MCARRFCPKEFHWPTLEVCRSSVLVPSHVTLYLSRLLSRVKGDQSSRVEVKTLFNAFVFETKESGNEIVPSQRIFLEHVVKVFPDARRERKTGNTKTKVTFYHGICLLPIISDHVVKPINLQEIRQNLPSGVQVVEEKNSHVICSMETLYSSNGNIIKKIIRFNENGQWSVEVCGSSIDLNSIYISNFYNSSEKGINIVIEAVKIIALCPGMEVTKSVTMGRYHILEIWAIEQVPCKRLRTMLCNRVVSLNSFSGICDKCRRMTQGSTIAKDTENDTANVKATPSPSAKDTENDTANVKATPSPSAKDTENDTTNVKATPSLNPTILTKEYIKQIVPGSTDEMAELILSQAQNASRDPRGRRWTQGMIGVCLQWFCRSPHSYEAFRASKFLILPSRSTLIQYKSRVKHKIGFDDDVLTWMYEEAQRKEIAEEGYTGGIIIDEMAIQSDLQICKNGDAIELTGFMDVGEEGNLSHIMRKGKNEKVLGTHALQLVFLGVTGFRFPIAHFISDGIQAPEIYPLFWEAVDKLRMYGFNVVYTCMDGAQSNRSFMNINLAASTNTFTTKCPCSFKSMTFIMDSKHVIKKIRNNVIKSGISKSSTRLLTLPNSDTVQWKMFVDCYEWDKTNALQLHRKLTNDHLHPSNQQKMRNHLAEDVLDSEMLNLLRQYQLYLGAKGSVLNGAIVFLKHTSRLIDIFSDMRPIKCCDDPRLLELLDIAKWFDDWKHSDSLPSKNKGKLIMSLQCHEDIQSCIIGFTELCGVFLKTSSKIYITPGLLNSDVIENTFNQQRSTYHGANSNPNALQYRRALNSIVLGQNIVSQKGNAGKNRAAALPYNCLLNKITPATKRKSCESTYSKIKVIRM